MKFFALILCENTIEKCAICCCLSCDDDDGDENKFYFQRDTRMIMIGGLASQPGVSKFIPVTGIFLYFYNNPNLFIA